MWCKHTVWRFANGFRDLLFLSRFDNFCAGCNVGVPTVWLNLLLHVKKHNLKMRYIKRVCIAGSAPPRSMIETLEG